MLTYGVDDTVLPIDPLNVNFRNFIDNFTDIDDVYISKASRIADQSLEIASSYL